MEQTSVVQLHQTKPDHGCPNNLSLRPLDVSDIDDFMVWATDEKVTRFCTWETHTNKEDGLNYIKNTVVSHPWFRAIWCHYGELEFGGYVLAAKYWGKGIGTRGVKMVGETIFEEWPQLENLGLSGFVREGVLRKYVVVKGRCRDRVMFSLLSTDHRQVLECIVTLAKKQ
ncbi:hypothetical protein V6N13_050650 [Hibiscus sabdariffa]|uniref:N-acetyltransferase domain-containing protein n=1 Tax=Hibiscus sabdariffa TaxID=183260 RepID=A0ABR2PIG0_9ROSI